MTYIKTKVFGERDVPVNIKHLYNICTVLGQRRRRWADVVQMLYKCLAERLTAYFASHAGVPGSSLTDPACGFQKDILFFPLSTLIAASSKRLKPVYRRQFRAGPRAARFFTQKVFAF